MRRSGSIQVIASLMFLAMSATSVAEQEPEEIRHDRLMMDGGDLSEPEAAKLEEGLKTHPNDLDARLQLVGFYFMKYSEESTNRKVDHITWCVTNHPELKSVGSPYLSLIPAMHGKAAYERVKKLWLEQVEANRYDVQVLANASRYFTLKDRTIAKDLIKKAKELDPDNPQWPERLAHLYSLDRMRGQADESKRGDSLEQMEAAVDNVEAGVMGKIRRLEMLPALAKAAYEGGEYEKAASYAQELLDQERWPDFCKKGMCSTGNFIHHGNSVLGRLALRDGDVDNAKKYLLESAKHEGSPQLNSFGPNMMLAKELIEKGETEAVLQYFELCRAFWKRAGKLDAWAKAVKAGEVPEFGGNLFY